MQRFKLITSLSVSFLFALLLASCGDDAGKSASGSSASSDGGMSSSSESASASSGGSSELSHDVVYEEEIYKNWPK